MIDFEKYMNYFNSHDMFSVNNGIQLVELEKQHAKAELTINDNHLNYMGSLHGGLLYTMADIVAGSSLLYCEKELVTLSSHIEYLKPAICGKVIALAKAINCGKTIGRSEVAIYGGDGVLYCKALISMFITNKMLKGFEK